MALRGFSNCIPLADLAEREGEQTKIELDGSAGNHIWTHRVEMGFPTDSSQITKPRRSEADGQCASADSSDERSESSDSARPEWMGADVHHPAAYGGHQAARGFVSDEGLANPRAKFLDTWMPTDKKRSAKFR